ncbi:MAG: hypothetical protein RLZZ292_253 [Bacteroidota bacterium]
MFYFIALLNLIGEFLDYTPLVVFTKPLLMPLLAWMFYRAVPKPLSSLSQIFLIALGFAWLGDVLLLLNKQIGNGTPIYFMTGLGSFLITHLLYAVVFIRYNNLPVEGKKEKGLVQFFPWIALPLLGYTVYSAWFLSAGIPSALQLPVITYCCVITFMGICALNLWNNLPLSLAQSLCLGAALFMLSDSIIGFVKFRSDVVQLPHAGVWVMATYSLGQYLITKAVAKFFL